MTKVLILESIVGSGIGYSRGDKLNLPDAEATRLINAGKALKLIEFSTDASTAIGDAAEDAGYTAMASGGALVPGGGGYYFADNLLHLVHPSGGHALIDPLYLLPRWQR